MWVLEAWKQFASPQTIFTTLNKKIHQNICFWLLFFLTFSSTTVALCLTVKAVIHNTEVRFRETHIMNLMNWEERGRRKTRAWHREGASKWELYSAAPVHTHTPIHTITLKHTDAAYKGEHLGFNVLLSPSYKKEERKKILYCLLFACKRQIFVFGLHVQKSAFKKGTLKHICIKNTVEATLKSSTGYSMVSTWIPITLKQG